MYALLALRNLNINVSVVLKSLFKSTMYSPFKISGLINACLIRQKMKMQLQSKDHLQLCRPFISRADFIQGQTKNPSPS